MAKKKEEKLIESNDINLDEVKGELRDYVDVQIRIKLKDEIEKSNRKLLKEKNKKIFWKNIIILGLLILVIYLLYLLNSVDYFDKFFLSNNKNTREVNIEEKNEVKEKKDEEPTLDELKSKYSNLLEYVIINEDSEYIDDFYNGNLSKELKKYIVLNFMDLKKWEQEEDYNLIDEEVFKEEYNKMFDDYSEGSFNFNNNKIRYINKIESYMSTGLIEKKTTGIVREIIDIKVNEDKVSITTIEGLLKDEELFNVVSLKEIENYEKDSIVNYEKELNKITYVFENRKLAGINK